MFRLNSAFRFSLCILLNIQTSYGLAISQKVEKIDASIAGYKPEIAQGQATELKAYGKGLEIRAVEITPPEGVSIREIKEKPVAPEDKADYGKDAKVWSIFVFAEKTAQLGERSIVLITPRGRSDPKVIRVTSHIPKINDVKVISVSNGEVKVEISAVDEAGDITPEKIPSCMFHFFHGDGPPNAIISFVPAEKVTMNDKNSFIIYVTKKLPEYSRMIEIGRVWSLDIQITDAERNNSNLFRTKVEFK